MSDIVCCPLSRGDGPGPSFFDERVVAGRKQYTCAECGEVILIGTKHERASGKWDGIVDNYRTCLSCVEIRNHFGKGCGGWIYGQVWADLEEYFFPTMRAGGPCMEGLSPAARARLFERRLAWLERFE